MASEATSPPTSVAPAGGAASASSAAVPAGATPSLYVGDLHADINEAKLFEAFNPFGPIASVRICRDAITRKSMGYGYVNFVNVADAGNAMKSLNYTAINGKPCRIMWAQRDPTLRRAGVNNVYVKNLHPSIDTRVLAEMFDMMGHVVSAKVCTDPAGKSRCFGFVAFQTPEAAKKAIETMNGFDYNGSTITVETFVPRSSRSRATEWTNCYVKNIPKAWTQAQLTDLFAKYGEISSATIVRGPSGESRGFGFVAYKNKDSAEAALKELNGKQLEEAVPPSTGTEGDAGAAGGDASKADAPPPLYVARHQSKTERQRELMKQYRERGGPDVSKNSNLYVKNLTEEVTDDDLRTRFAKYGTITSARVMRDTNGASKGFGFVGYSSPEEAQKALSEQHKQIWFGRPLHVSLFQRRDERSEALERARMTFARQATSVATQRMPAAPASAMAAQVAAPGMAGMGMQGGMPPGMMNQQTLMALQQQQQQMMMTYLGMGMPPATAVQMVQSAMLMQLNAMAGGSAPKPGAAAPGAAPQGMQAPAGYAAGGAPAGPAAGFGPGAARPGMPPAGVAPGAAGMMAGGSAPRGVPPTGTATTTAPGSRPPAAFMGPAGAVPRGAPVPGAGAPRGVLPGAGMPPAAGGMPRGVMPPSAQGPARGMPPMAVRPAGPAGVPARGYAAAVTGGSHGAPVASAFAEQLARASPDERRNMLGERLYPHIQSIDAARAPKITGMLLDMEPEELLHLLESREALAGRVREAQEVLQKTAAAQGGHME